MPRRKSNDIDLARVIFAFLILLALIIFLYLHQILDALGWLAVILPIPLLLLGLVSIIFGKKLLSRPNISDVPSSHPGHPVQASHVTVSHYPPRYSQPPSPESSFAPSPPVQPPSRRNS